MIRISVGSLLIFVGCTTSLALVIGCVGSPVHATVKYSQVQSRIQKTNSALLDLQIGVSRAETRELLGQPERSEGYPWGTVWLYRTAMTSGIYGTADSDFTPVVFDQEGALIGWGRNYFEERVRRYELTIRTD